MPIAPEEGMTAGDIRAANAAVNQARIANNSTATTKTVSQPTASVVATHTPSTPGFWRKAEEASNADYYASLKTDPIPVKNLIAQNQPAPSPVYSVPLTPAPVTSAASSIAKTITVPIKTATPDIVLFDDSVVPIEIMTDLIFEEIGGQELINISRTDTINGQKILYQPIKNINIINQEYNPNNILGLQKTSDKYFSGYAIKFEERVPKVSNSLDGNPVYVDSAGNIVIDSINLNTDEQVEIQVTVSGTIYEAEFGATIS
jgi:hypothetical protein